MELIRVKAAAQIAMNQGMVIEAVELYDQAAEGGSLEAVVQLGIFCHLCRRSEDAVKLFMNANRRGSKKGERLLNEHYPRPG